MKARVFKFLGILSLTTVSLFYVKTHDNFIVKAAQFNLSGDAHLKLAKTSYQLGFKKISKLDESLVDLELKSIHHISEKISQTSISNDGDIMITLAKSIDNNIVLVIFKKQKVQMIQKIINLTDTRLDFQYGSLEFSQNASAVAYNQNIELEF